MPVSIWEGAKADALIEAVGNSRGSGFSNDVKIALMNLLRHVAYADENGLSYLADLEDAFETDIYSETPTPIFTLPSAFVSTGANSVSTGVTMEHGKNYTLLAEFTPSGIPASGTTVEIFSNKGSGSAHLTGTITRKSSSELNFWGWAIKTDYMANLIQNNTRHRVAFTINYTTSITMGYVWNGSTSAISGFIRPFSDMAKQYNDGGEFIFGKDLHDGFTGTVHNAMIYERELNQYDIQRYLKQGVAE